MNLMRFVLSLGAVFCSFQCEAAQKGCEVLPQPEAGQRYLVVISDLHFGLGRGASGATWNPKEDFRWSNALAGFLNQVAICGNDSVDLVVAGDMLEMWQPPEAIQCVGPTSESGCTPDEALQIASEIIKQHGKDLGALGQFTYKGSNRLSIVPGNHDAALLIPSVWTSVSAAINAKPDSIRLVDSGVWVSTDGKVLVEHGHQIGSDVNKFAAWPKVTVEQSDGKSYLHRSWGENFVQALFNKQEEMYPVIDNLSPETAGARYRMADRGLWKSAADVAQFLKFNLFETSFAQKTAVLGEADTGGGVAPKWDLPLARSLGHELFAIALQPDDPFLLAMQSSTPEAEELRVQLTILAKDPALLSDAEVESLCNQAVVIRREKSKTCKNTLGAAAERILSSRKAVLAKHLNDRLSDKRFREMRMFVYGHTHLLEEKSEVPTKRWDVSVFNTGAFQRTIDDAEFLLLAKKRAEEPEKTLKAISVGDLGACYSAVVAALGKSPVGLTVRWNMDESGSGVFVLPGNAACLPKALRN